MQYENGAYKIDCNYTQTASSSTEFKSFGLFLHA
jgi:hypothetical protein